MYYHIKVTIILNSVTVRQRFIKLHWAGLHTNSFWSAAGRYAQMQNDRQQSLSRLWTSTWKTQTTFGLWDENHWENSKWTDRKLRNNRCSSLDLRNGFLYKCQETRAENLTDDVYEVKLITKSWVHVHRPPLTAGTSRLFWLSIFACSDLRNQLYRNPFRGRNRWVASILIL